MNTCSNYTVNITRDFKTPDSNPYIKILDNYIKYGYTNSLMLDSMGIKGYRRVKNLKYDYIIALGHIAYRMKINTNKRGRVLNTMYDIVFKYTKSIKNSYQLFDYLLEKLNLYREV